MGLLDQPDRPLGAAAAEIEDVGEIGHQLRPQRSVLLTDNRQRLFEQHRLYDPVGIEGLPAAPAGADRRSRQQGGNAGFPGRTGCLEEGVAGLLQFADPPLGLGPAEQQLRQLLETVPK